MTILGVFWSSWIFWVFWSFYTFRGCFGDFNDFRGILVILEIFEIFLFLEVLGLFWQFYVFWSIYRFQNSKFQILLCINESKQEILKSMNFELRHFKFIDLKSKSKSKFKYPNTTRVILYFSIRIWNNCVNILKQKQLL